MVKQISIGAKGTAEERVQFDNTLTAHNRQLPPIFSTAEMLRLMETAGSHALQPFCEPGEISVGTTVHIEHRLPVGINAVVRATAEVEAVTAEAIELRVVVSEGGREIGGGTVTRIIVNVDDYLAKNDIPKP
jgi:predicted thioesterase